MKPTWDSLAQEYEGSAKILIADVDCTAGGKDLCEKFGIEGFPTIKYFNPPDDQGEDYEGGRDLEDFKAFASTSLGPSCSAGTRENCSPEQLVELDAVLLIPAADREKELEEIQTALSTAQEVHDELLKSLQAQYEESEKSVDDLKKSSMPRIKILKSAGTVVKAVDADADKDEV